VGTALLIGYFNELPEPRAGEDPRRWERRLQEALEGFRRKVAERYTEGTLQRLLDSANSRARRAATLALGLMGTMQSNEALAARLHDEDTTVRQLAADALWMLWFRADTEANNLELQRVMRLDDRAEALAGFDRLIKRAPTFAEAYNQRAIVHFQLKDYVKSIADCEKVIQLNPVHFGACSGMAQCYLNLRRPRAALKAFRETYRINPNMKGIEETIRDLESVLGEEGKRDEKK
jgi:tetratricopeptide (TPR) repeat protein